MDILGSLKKIIAASKPRREAGFSLVELSIVLIIIGLIVGGIMKGQDLIDSARLKSVVSQINNYQMAVRAYDDRFDRLPGDDDGASVHLKSDLKNGNGDGIVDGDESVLFWDHLAAAGLIALPGQGDKLPTTKLGGVIMVQHDPHKTMTGHWFVLGRKSGDGLIGLLTPAQAHAIDQKNDTGRPDQGFIRALSARESTDPCVTADGTHYQLDTTKPACILYFQFSH